MRRNRIISRRGERGVVVMLVAIFLLFVVSAMAVLAIDAVTFYTARSEAQLAADGAALAGARVMANSGSTSDPSLPLQGLAQALAISTATQVAAQNKVGGRNLNPATEVVITFPPTVGQFYNPRVQVQVTRSDLPTFFARIWGRTQVTVSATATAEAYNPSGLNLSLGAGGPVAPVCVKPWLLPNLDPGGGGAIFDLNGNIVAVNGLGRNWPLRAKCSTCTPPLGPPTAGMYYPGAIDPGDFPVPTQSLPTGSTGFNDYQMAVAACVPKPISCGATANINIDTNTYSPTNGISRDDDTVQAAKLLIHDTGATGDSDSIDALTVPSPPFQFIAGAANPIAIASPSAVGQNIMVSNSLVTVPVFDDSTGVNQPVQVIGFLQLFLNPQATPLVGPQIQATIINMAGCGKTAAGQAILGAGSSPIPVRLVGQ